MSDAINPSHYKSHPSGVECITIAEYFGFTLGNAIKYLWRAGLKSADPVEDLRKAAWYVDREIKRLGVWTGDRHALATRTHPSGVECVTIAEYFRFNLGNAIECIWSAEFEVEEPMESLRKAAWHIDREIKRLSGKQ